MEDKGRQPGTIKTHLGSLKIVHNFVVAFKPEILKDVSHAEIDKVRTLVTTWCRNYHKKKLKSTKT